MIARFSSSVSGPERCKVHVMVNVVLSVIVIPRLIMSLSGAAPD
jgi:hypothetical protein